MLLALNQPSGPSVIEFESESAMHADVSLKTWWGQSPYFTQNFPCAENYCALARENAHLFMSWYTEPNCTGDEYALLTRQEVDEVTDPSFEKASYSTWDGEGLIGLAPRFSVTSQSGRLGGPGGGGCVTKEVPLAKGVSRVYR